MIGEPEYGRHTFSYPMYGGFRNGTSDVFSGVAARYTTPVNVGWNGVSERATAELVSGNYFEVLGVGSTIGRPLTPVVVGVLPAHFRGVDPGTPADIFVPLAMKRAMTPTWDMMDHREAAWLNILARLKPGISPQQAQVTANVVYRREQQLDVKLNRMMRPRNAMTYLKSKFAVVGAAKGLSGIRESFSTPLVILMVCTLLLIACGNVANLMVARATMNSSLQSAKKPGVS